jgi:hypothetical protein
MFLDTFALLTVAGSNQVAGESSLMDSGTVSSTSGAAMIYFSGGQNTISGATFGPNGTTAFQVYVGNSASLTVTGSTANLGATLHVGVMPAGADVDSPGTVSFGGLAQNLTIRNSASIWVSSQGTLYLSQDVDIANTGSGNLTSSGTVSVSNVGLVFLDLPVLCSSGGSFTLTAGSQLQIQPPGAATGYTQRDADSSLKLNPGCSLFASVTCTGGTVYADGSGSGTLGGVVSLTNTDLVVGQTAGSYYDLTIGQDFSMLGGTLSFNVNGASLLQCSLLRAMGQVTLRDGITLRVVTDNVGQLAPGPHSYGLIFVGVGTITGDFAGYMFVGYPWSDYGKVQGDTVYQVGGRIDPPT